MVTVVFVTVSIELEILNKNGQNDKLDVQITLLQDSVFFNLQKQENNFSILVDNFYKGKHILRNLFQNVVLNIQKVNVNFSKDLFIGKGIDIQKG